MTAKNLDTPSFAFDCRRQHLADSRIVPSTQLLPFNDRQRPARNQTDARNPIVLLPVTDEQLVFHTQPLGDSLCLRGLGARPGLDQADNVGIHRDQRILDRRLSLLPLPVATQTFQVTTRTLDSATGPYGAY